MLNWACWGGGSWADLEKADGGAEALVSLHMNGSPCTWRPVIVIVFVPADSFHKGPSTFFFHSAKPFDEKSHSKFVYHSNSGFACFLKHLQSSQNFLTPISASRLRDSRSQEVSFLTDQGSRISALT